MNLELREKVARLVMGLPDVQRVGTQGLGFDNGMTLQSVPHYETDIAAAWQVEARIAERGLQDKYGIALGEIVDEWRTRGHAMFDLAHATPEQRCLAAVVAIESEARDGKA